MLFLKQSTASQSVLLGPFVDSTDGATAETALTIANTDIRLSKNGGNMAAKNSGGGTHDENGWYTITLDATDTDTVGRLQVSCKVAGALAVFMEFQVLEETIYDALIGASAAGELAVKLSTQGKADVNAEADTALTDYDPPTKTEMDSAFTEIKGATWATTDTLEAIRDRGDAAWITATGFSTHSAADVWSAGTRTLTANTNLNDPTAASIADAVWDEATTGHVTAGTFGQQLKTDVDAILADTGTDGVVVASGSKSGYALSAAGVDAIWDETLSGHSTLGTAGGELKRTADSRVNGSAQTGTLSTTQASTDLTGYADDQLIGRVVVWLTGNAAGEATDITDYANTSGVLTFTALTAAPANGDTFVIV